MLDKDRLITSFADRPLNQASEINLPLIIYVGSDNKPGQIYPHIHLTNMAETRIAGNREAVLVRLIPEMHEILSRAPRSSVSVKLGSDLSRLLATCLHPELSKLVRNEMKSTDEGANGVISHGKAKALVGVIAEKLGIALPTIESHVENAAKPGINP